ncbi:MAG: glycosyltransferase family 2 protein [Lachnospiraceae bacterium]|nr:glycosyltransferase family 2 protein [Lachnospiraceae bacterium]
MKLLSAIVPCYNEEENVAFFYEEFIKNKEFFEKKDLTYELIYVDDGSSDRTAHEVKKLRERDEKVHLISFSRNFGKESAMYAGLKRAKGDFVVLLDADLQDPPSLLPEMYGYLEEGYDCAATRRVTRKGEPPIRSLFARGFYKLINHNGRVEIVDGARDFRLMTRQMVDAVLSVTEYNRFSKGIFAWVGFKTKWVEYENVERAHGETKWSFWGLFRYALDGMLSFSSIPLAVTSLMGVLFCIVAFVMLLFVWVRALIFGDPTSGWPSLVCIILLASGVQLLCLGVLGQYLSKTYMEVKHRPIYVVKEEE